MEHIEPVLADLAALSPELPSGLLLPSARKSQFSLRRKHDATTSASSTVAIWGGKIPDFLGSQCPLAAEILHWPDPFLERIKNSLLQSLLEKGLTAEEAKELQTRGLMNPHGKLTRLGYNLTHHIAEYEKPFSTADNSIFQSLKIDSRSQILDVGCGIGQTLNQLRIFEPQERVGLDTEILNLALGSRLNPPSTGEKIHFVCASAMALPFIDNRFTHVICRVALNYMIQDRALREIMRVLKPGGYFYCSYGDLGYDLLFLSKARSMRQAVLVPYRILWGMILSLTGFQMPPGRFPFPGQIYSTLPRIKKIIQACGGKITACNSTRFLGFPSITTLCIRK